MWLLVATSQHVGRFSFTRHSYMHQESEMTFARAISITTFIAAIAVPFSSAAVTPDLHENHHPASANAVQIAQMMPVGPGTGMGGTGAVSDYAQQMQAMQQMHDKMLAAKTPEERNALMAEQMTLMHGGMAMMGQMGSTMMSGASGHIAGPDGKLEQRMDMMQSMMQMMMDRMQYAPAAK